MKCRLKLIGPAGDVINEIKHNIPIGVYREDSMFHFKNFLFIGEYAYHIKKTGEIIKVLPKNTITEERYKEIKELWKEKIQKIQEGLL